MCNLSVHIRALDLARMINNNMKTPRDEILLLHLPLQAGSFYDDGYNLENKDRGLTSLSGCTPADVAPC